LIVVRLANGQHRSFYDNATDYTILESWFFLVDIQVSDCRIPI
jgi:hypothetical protein